MSTIKVILGDCMEIMAQYEPKYFDLAVVDPPYGIGVNSMNMGGRKTVTPDKRKWDDFPPDLQYFQELERVSKYLIIFGGNYFNLPPSKSFIIWDKGETMYGRDFAECEFAWVSHDKPAKIVKINPNQLDRIHPTQKPVALYDWIYQKYLPEGGKVLDTHGGSMSNVISWIKAGNIDGVCTEIDPDYFHDAKKRIQNFLAQQDMFRNPVTVEFIENKMSMK